MKAEELRSLSKEELEARLRELREELFSLNTKSALGTLEKTHRRREVRREIARVLTIMREKGYL
ncbi:MAG: 50S ribosomal protein L29 [Thermoproteota archaeon]|nr:MAG: 50S ribosomal protein L29 [Candidatus Korarchaeota archaeon]